MLHTAKLIKVKGVNGRSGIRNTAESYGVQERSQQVTNVLPSKKFTNLWSRLFCDKLTFRLPLVVLQIQASCMVLNQSGSYSFCPSNTLEVRQLIALGVFMTRTGQE